VSEITTCVLQISRTELNAVKWLVNTIISDGGFGLGDVCGQKSGKLAVNVAIYEYFARRAFKWV